MDRVGVPKGTLAERLLRPSHSNAWRTAVTRPPVPKGTLAERLLRQVPEVPTGYLLGHGVPKGTLAERLLRPGDVGFPGALARHDRSRKGPWPKGY